MTISDAYRWRKTTDVNREHALFALMEGEAALLDVGFSDDGKLEIAFNPRVSSKTIGLAEFLDMLEEGKRLAELEFGDLAQTHIQYMKCDWLIDDPAEPVTIYSELDEHRWETRKVHVFADGHRERAGPDEETEQTALGLEPVPSLEFIASDKQFNPSEITQDEFERIWRSAARNGDVQ